MRVALLTQNARAGDALGRQLVEKVGCFLDRGADVRVVLADDRGLHPALKPYAIRQTPDDLRTAGFQALLQADFVVVEYSQYYPLLELLPLVADGSRKVLLDYHGVTPSQYSAANHREALLRGGEYRGLAGFADAVIAHSRFAEDELAEAIDLPPERAHRLGYAIDDTWLAPGEPKKSLRALLGVGDARLLLFVGRLAANKRVPVLIEALDHLRDGDFHVAIVGPSGDCYEAQRLRCRELAADLGVSDRVHFVGEVDESTLRDAYRSADALVIPSIHEGFCFPVIEAMACGLPVIAARAAALPETVGDAGLTFTPDDPVDLARQVQRAFAVTTPSPTKRIAIVTPAYGLTVGGAERSLSLIARKLHEAGVAVEVFTTCDESEGATPFPVRVFRADPAPRSNETSPDRAGEACFWQQSLRSGALLEALKATDPFAAYIVGPFPSGLTRDVVRSFGKRAVMAPCLHNEPAAHWPGVREMFETAGGVLFHSSEERELADIKFGFNHPNSAVIGTWIDELALSPPLPHSCSRALLGNALPAKLCFADDRAGQSAESLADDCPPSRAWQAVRSQAELGNEDSLSRYIVYVGRFLQEKNLPELFAFARRYAAEHPGRFRFVFVGAGELPIPEEPWAINLGRLSDAEKNDVIAGASALVNLSVNESLSLVVLESQAIGAPVLVNAASPVLAAHVERSKGGRAITGYEGFSTALDELWTSPQLFQAMGQAGREYVRREFGSSERFVATVRSVVANLDQSFTEVMRAAGLRRAAQFSRANWRTEFERVLEWLTDERSVYRTPQVEIASLDSIVESDVWRVVLSHKGGASLVPSGPGRTELLVRRRDAAGEIIGDPWAVALRELIVEGDEVTIAVGIPPTGLAEFTLEPGLRTRTLKESDAVLWFGPLVTVRPVAVVDVPRTAVAPRPLRRTIDRARVLADLPNGYVDVTTGRFARWKSWIKQKLLHNFRAAYVDVLARQQSRFNRRVLEAVAEIAADAPHIDDAQLRQELAESRRRCDELARRVARLEAQRVESVSTTWREAS